MKFIKPICSSLRFDFIYGVSVYLEWLVIHSITASIGPAVTTVIITKAAQNPTGRKQWAAQHCALSKSYYIVEWYLCEVVRHNLTVFNYKMLDLLRLRLYTVRVVVSGMAYLRSVVKRIWARATS